MTAGTFPTFTMHRISHPVSKAPDQVWDYVIVGSGYGGGIAASRLARAGFKVCVLERGHEILPGEYPKDLQSAQDAIEVMTARDGPLPRIKLEPKEKHPAPARGMMQLRVGDDVNVILGNGLGGGSLVNAGVSIRPDMRVFQEGWPRAYALLDQTDAKGNPVNALTDHFDTVAGQLGATEVPPEKWPPKMLALQQSAARMKQKFTPADINVTFKTGENAFGFKQAACTMCGDCCSGCNYGAKNTLVMNYLPDAHRNGAFIATCAEVDVVRPDGDGYLVSLRDQPQTLRTRGVIFAAGSLGSTEILMRSRKAGLAVAKDALGTRFSTNGDVLGFGFGANVPGSKAGEKLPATPLYSIGAGDNPPDRPEFQPGPTITGIIRVDMDNGAPLKDGLVIEDGTAPGPLAQVYPPALFLQEAATANPSRFPDATDRLQALKTLADGLQTTADPSALAYSGIMAQLQSYLVMSHDTAAGKLVLGPKDYVHVSYPDAGNNAPYPRDNAKLAEAAAAIWADYIPNPIWQQAFGNSVVTVHPLGGCPMADSDTLGVTDADCRVYTGDGNNGVHPNLLVCDGAVIPTALGVNPLLTISAVANRAMDRLIADRKVNPPPKLAEVRPPVLGTRIEQPVPVKTYADIARDIDYVRYGTYGIRLASLFGRGLTRWALKMVLKRVFPQNWSPAWKVQTDDFVAAAQPSDLRRGFRALGQVLDELSTSIRRVAPEGARKAFLNSFFKHVQDVAPGMAFSESMRGWVSTRRDDQSHALVNPYELAQAVGKADGRHMVAAFDIRTPSLLGHDDDKNVIAQLVGAQLTGTVTVTEADGTPQDYELCDGVFDLLQPDPSKVETWTMSYRCKLRPKGAAQPCWSMVGTKILERRSGSSFSRDLTTLFVDLTWIDRGPGTDLQGIIALDLQALAAQVATITTPYRHQPDLNHWLQKLMQSARNRQFAAEVRQGPLLHDAFAALLACGEPPTNALEPETWPKSLHDGLQEFFAGGIAETFGMLVLRTYGGFLSYMNDFPSESDGKLFALPVPGVTKIHGVTCSQHTLPDKTAPKVMLYHFPAPNAHLPARGPVLLAPGMSTTALSFACLTNGGENLVKELLKDNFDVWLFDSRLSPRVKPINHGYTLDDVAQHDWPMAVNYVLEQTKAANLQIVAHCVGSLTAQMALLGGWVKREQVRQMVLMQFTALPAANWFNVIKSEIGVARDFSSGFPPLLSGLVKSALDSDEEWDVIGPILKNGIPTICPVSAGPGSPDYKVPLDEIHNAIDWNAPFGIDHECLSPTCHRIYGLYGPVIAHKNLNQDTHNAMRQIFGEIATLPFVQLGMIMERGKAVTADGRHSYLKGYENLRMPIHIISGDQNQIILSESGYFMQQWLRHKMPDSSDLFTWEVAKGYAHNDCIIGKNAHNDIFPMIMEQLNRPYNV